MKRPIIVALMATHERERLLLDRALPSVLSQTRPADAIVVIDDGGTTDLAARLPTVTTSLQYLANRRTPSLSGSLNTGLDHLARYHSDPRAVFVAFLDDDDAWMPGHLAEIEARISEGAEVVATPFLRVETGHVARRVDPPTTIFADQFMEGNPGIQGTNLAVRLDILLEAGGFNEALRACTDRDLLIRLCRRPRLRYAATLTPSAAHHACFDRPRLSLPGSSDKHAGLQMFDVIHGPLMTSGRRARHLERAARLFDWHPAPGATEMAPRHHHPPAAEAETPPLLVGIIADDRRIMSVSRLLDDLGNVIENEGLEPPDVLVLENRPGEGARAELEDMLAQKRKRLRIRLIGHAQLKRLARSGEWHPEGSDRVRAARNRRCSHRAAGLSVSHGTRASWMRNLDTRRRHAARPVDCDDVRARTLSAVAGPCPATYACDRRRHLHRKLHWRAPPSCSGQRQRTVERSYVESAATCLFARRSPRSNGRGP